MLRRLHSLPGLWRVCSSIFMALSGAFLSLQPAIDQWQAGTAATQLDVADLVRCGCRQLPDVSRIVKMASGAVIAYSDGAAGQMPRASIQLTGAVLGPLRNLAGLRLHDRTASLAVPWPGRPCRGRPCRPCPCWFCRFRVDCCWSRAWAGGPRCLAPPREASSSACMSTLAARAGRAAAQRPDRRLYVACQPRPCVDRAGWLHRIPHHCRWRHAAPCFDSPRCRRLPLAQLRELVFPAPGDPTDVFTLTTNAGQGFVDQATGAMLGFVPNTSARPSMKRSIPSIPARALRGSALCSAWPRSRCRSWPPPVRYLVARRRDQPRLGTMCSAGAADTIILVGSEGNSTWGFAATLHDAPDTGWSPRAHSADECLSRRYHKARHMFVLTATYGDGAAPQSASRFLSRLEQFKTSAGSGLCGARLWRPQLRQFLPICRPTSRQRCVAKGMHRFQPLARSIGNRRRPSRNGAIEPAARWARRCTSCTRPRCQAPRLAC